MQKREERAILSEQSKISQLPNERPEMSTWRYFEFVRRQARYGATRHKVGRMKIAATLKPVQSAI